MKQRYIPENSTAVEFPDVNAVAYLYENARGYPCLIAYSGKKSKPSLFYRYSNEEQRQQRLDSWVEGLRKYEEDKKERRAVQNKPSELEVGNILVSSWGYGQTNIDFYQVTKVIGKRKIEIRPISQINVETAGHDSEYVEPFPYNFTGDPMVKVVTGGKRVRITSFAGAGLWDGKRKFQSHWH